MSEDPVGDEVPKVGNEVPGNSGEDQSLAPDETEQPPEPIPSPAPSEEDEEPAIAIDDSLAMSPPGVTELSDEQQDRVNAANQAAADATDDGNYELGIKRLTEAISLGCATAMLYAKRAQLLFRLGRNEVCIRDCSAAIAVNENSAKAYRIRARCYENLRKWEAADKDYQTSLQIDFDDDTEEMSKEAAEKAKAIREERAGKKRARVEQEKGEYQKKLRADGEAYQKGLRANEEKFKGQEAEDKKLEAERKKAAQAPTKKDVEAAGGEEID